MPGKSLAESCAERDAEDTRRAVEWQRAVDKLSVTFEADHEGGCPACLKGKTPAERLTCLRSLGFRVKEQFDRDCTCFGTPPELHQCCYLEGWIFVDLTEGWVYRWKRGGGGG